MSAVLPYLAIRGQYDGPLFRLGDGRPLTRMILVQRLRDVLTRAGIDCSRYSGHSFRIGAATTAIARGVSDATVQTLGRWASDSFKRYVRIPSTNIKTELGQIGMSIVTV